MSGSDVTPEDLLKFPKFVKNQKKIIIEFYDCIIKANDLVDFQILIDDNKNRATTLINFEESIKQNLENGISGTQINSNINNLRNFNNLFKFSDSYKLVSK